MNRGGGLWLARESCQGLLLVVLAAAFLGCDRHTSPSRTEPASPTIPPQRTAGDSDPEPASSPAPEPEAAPPVPNQPIPPATTPGSVLELQPWRRSLAMEIEGAPGSGRATLVNLNPGINAWFLLELTWPGRARTVYHLENPRPGEQQLVLDPVFRRGLVLRSQGQAEPCDLWSSANGPFTGPLPRSASPYLSLCQGRLYLRKQVSGHRTAREWATDSLRDYVWGGEQITVFIRNTFYQDAFLSTSEVIEGTPGEVARSRPAGAPEPPLLKPEFDRDFLAPGDLAIELVNETPGRVQVGRWYPTRNRSGVFVSTIQPRMVAREVAEAQGRSVNSLDEVEDSALVHLMAFDLDQFRLGFALGTEHPRVDWSDRVLEEVRDSRLPGPDGIGSIDPLVSTGMLNPVDARRATATFTGGFKRYHGAFRRGDLANRNRGTHYGFIENGVVLSRLHPGLATALVLDDGTVELKTWTDADEARLGRIRHARQNGVPIIESDPATGNGRPGEFVARPAFGNWSGSVEGKYRTLRAGICLQQREERKFLIYGYFSSATASAMARVFQAYGCSYAMLTDMNALEHTYLALYTSQDSELHVQHLIRGMEVLDKTSEGRVIPRFIGYADNRDFFYLLQKE